MSSGTKLLPGIGTRPMPPSATHGTWAAAVVPLPSPTTSARTHGHCTRRTTTTAHAHNNGVGLSWRGELRRSRKHEQSVTERLGARAKK